MQKKTKNAFNKSEAFIVAKVIKLSGINKARKKFMIHIFLLFLGLRGRFNFLNMHRYGHYSEQSYRNQFDKKFDFIGFNTEIIKTNCSSNLINAFDPSYIPKSGDKTEHIGKFWSGCSAKALKGIEIGGFAVIDIDNNTALSLEAIQTPSVEQLREKNKTLVNHYASLVIERKDNLLNFSSYLAVDGYFAKADFINPVTEQTSLKIISKMRTDANLYYVYKGERTGKKGRPKTIDGKIDMKNPDKTKFRLCFENDAVKVYEAIVYSKTLKRQIKLAYAEFWKNQKYTGRYAVLFSTDLDLPAQKIYLYYKSRFQIEFLYRDAKQFSGLTHCQARNENKMHFHFNTSLTTINIAKAVYFLKNKKKVNESFSMSDVKSIHLNKIIADRIFANLDINLSCYKIRKVYRNILWLGRIAC